MLSDAKQDSLVHIRDPMKLYRLWEAIKANKQSFDITKITKAFTKLLPTNPKCKHIWQNEHYPQKLRCSRFLFNQEPLQQMLE